jgi:hypothetical protein
MTAAGSLAAVWALPDSQLTPGAVATTDSRIVCTPGYAGTVRPTGAQWRELKNDMYLRYGKPKGQRFGFASDHLVPLELGGAPTDERNLWPQPYSQAKVKDRVEATLHVLVCDHRLLLTTAQARIAQNWTTAVPQTLSLSPREIEQIARISETDY